MSITPLERRVLEVSYAHGLTHLGSCLTCLPLIEEVYQNHIHEGIFLLGEGHAGLALYVVLEKHYGVSADWFLQQDGIHAARHWGHVEKRGVWSIPMSSGSLGQVESTAPGFALRNRDRKVFLLTSDGAMQEGVCWSALRLKADLGLTNLIWVINCNGYSALAPIDADTLERRAQAFCPDVVVHRTGEVLERRFPFLRGLDAHYHRLTPEDWAWVQAQEVSL